MAQNTIPGRSSSKPMVKIPDPSASAEVHITLLHDAITFKQIDRRVVDLKQRKICKRAIGIAKAKARSALGMKFNSTFGGRFSR